MEAVAVAKHPAWQLAGGLEQTRRRTAPAEIRFAVMPRVSLLTTGFALALAFAPAVSAAPQQQGSNCDSNYEGACVPIASDVDCEGGGGNGPAYVQGPVRVVGNDIYQLDREGDGVACEPK
jgi:hypothetical protein